MTRRQFTAGLLAAAAAALTGTWSLLRARSARWREAIRHGRFPGRLRPLDEQAMRQPGHWSG